MDKIRILLAVGIGLLLLGITYFTYSARDKEPLQTFPATIDNDCAPWDGTAFTISVQYDPATVIYISIWRAPDIRFPSTFPMPDDVEAEQDGYAYILPELGPFVPLNGEVSLERVEAGKPVEGRFSFTSGRGDHFEGQFIAEWGNEMVLCG
ncbi:MAG: hypothetical protein R3307_05995 [Anaerolineales bacterium]|nr:hypothetical protein [Anaerolineales bacterium]